MAEPRGVDRGGLRYPIEIGGQWKNDLAAFRREVLAAKKDLDDLKSAKAAAVSRLQTGASSTSKQLREEASARNIVLEGRRRYNAETTKQAVSQQYANAASQQAFNNERRLLTSKQNLLKVEKGLTGLINQRRLAEQAVAVVQQRNLEISDKALARQVRVPLAAIEAAKKQAKLQTDAEKAAIRNIQKVETVSRAEKDLNRILGDRKIIQDRLNALSQRGIATTGLTSDQAVKLGFASKLPTDYYRGVSPTQTKTLLEQARGWLNLSKAQEHAGKRASGLAFTFRRLFGVLAAFTIAREIMSRFIDTIKQMASINAQIEQSALGLSALFLAVGTVRDEFGDIAEGSYAMALAMKEARKQIELLRQDSLKTTAGFQQLAETFQVAVAPGLKAGLNLDEIRNFSVRISQAAAAIGLQQNQLAEEIRSILSGTIQARTTRIAVALGISNEDIRRAREAGTLAEFLTDKFSAFAEMSNEVGNTFNGLMARIKNAFSLVLQTGGLEYFNKLKGLLRDIFSTLAVQDPLTGMFSPSPQALQVVEAFAAGLSEAVDAAQRLIKAMDFDTVLTSVKAIGFALGTIPQILVGVISGLIKGFSDVANIIKTLSFGLIKPGDVKNLQGFVEIITRAIVIVLALKAGLSLALVGVTGLFRVLTGGAMLFRLALTGIMAVPFGPWIAGIALAIAAVVWIVKELTDYTAKLTTEAHGALVRGNAQRRAAMENLGKLDELAKKTHLNNDEMAVAKKLIASLTSSYGDLGIRLDETTGKLTGVAEAQAKATDMFRESAKLQTQAAELERIKNINELYIERNKNSWSFSEEEARSIKERLNIELSYLRAIRAQQKALEDGSTAGITGEGIPIESGVKSLTSSLDETKNSAIDLNDEFARMPSMISASHDPLAKSGKLVDEFKKKLQAAKKEFDLAESTRGLSSTVAEMQRAVINAQHEAWKESESLSKQLTEQSQEQQRIQGLVAQARARVANLSLIDKGKVQEVTAEYEKQMRLEREAGEIRSKIASLETKLATAKAGEHDTLQDQIEFQRSLLSIRLEEIDSQKKYLETLPQEKMISQEIIDIAIEEITTNAKLKDQNQQIAETKADILELDKKRNEVLNLQLQTMARQSAFELAQANRAAIQSNLNTRSEMVAKNLGPGALKVAQAQSALSMEQLKYAEMLTQQKQDMTRLDKLISQHSKSNIADVKAVAELEKTRLLLKQNQLAAQDSENLKIAQLTEQLNKVQDPFGKGFAANIRDTLEQIPSITDTVFQSVNDLVTGVSQALSEAFVSAFDPNNNATIQERLASLMQAIATQILASVIANMISMLIMQLVGGSLTASMPLLLASAAFQKAATDLQDGALGLFVAAMALQAAADTLLTANMIGAATPGLHSGGNIGQAFFRARGYAVGGIVRPSNLHPDDTVPIWASPKEWIIRASAVAKYGGKVLHAINQGLIDPLALKAVANIPGVPLPSTRISGSGYAEGGPVSGASNFPSSTNSPSPAYIVANDQALDRLLHGGRNAVLRFMSRHRKEIATVLK